MDKFELKHSTFFFFFYFCLVLCPLVAADEEGGPTIDYLKLPTEQPVAPAPASKLFDYYRLALSWAPAVWKLSGAFCPVFCPLVAADEEEGPRIDYLKLPTEQAVAPAPAPESNSFDYYRLALQWAPSVWKRTDKAPESFTIHGLWPDVNSGDFLSYCNPNDRFQTITDPVLLASMNNNWPSVESNNNVGFWSYQWRKHGTCSGLSQTVYWNLALNLYGKYDILQQLRKDNIVPSNTVRYAVTKIKNSVKTLTSKEPDILCYSGKLAEIRICVEPANPYNAIDCPAHHSAMCSGNTRLPLSA